MTPPPPCVECRRQPADPTWRPFCSERCRNLDLARWVDGTYRVSGEPVATPDDESESQ
ncbi:MAG: DNA gyrase inhibitor YacG [Vicinamibacterales bacterium]